MLSVRRSWRETDGVAVALLTVALALAGWGLVAVLSASYPRAVLVHQQDFTHFLVQQTRHLVVGLAAAALLCGLPLARLQRRNWPWLLYGASLLLLFLPLTPLGTDLNRDARRWLQLGPVMLQPWEFAKVGLMIWMAAFLARNRRRLHDIISLGVFLLLGLLVPTLLLQQQPHLGAVMVLVCLGLGLYYVAGGARAHLAITLLVMAAIGGALVRGYQWDRVEAWWRPMEYHSETAQIRHGLAAIAEGSWTGRGLGNSVRKFTYVPECYTDSIMPIVAEEVGWTGMALILLLFVVLLRLGLRTAAAAATPFEQLLATGATLLISGSGLLNLAVVTKMLPQTGLPMPFFSYGGSHLLSSFLCLGLLLHIARRAGRPAGQQGEEHGEAGSR